MALKKCTPQKLQQVARQAGKVIKETKDGRYQVLEADTKAYVGTFNTTDEAQDAISHLAVQNAPDLDGDFPIPVRGVETTSAEPPRIQDNLIGRVQSAFSRAGLAGMQLAPIIRAGVPMRQLSRNIEKLGIGKASSVIFEPLLRGVRRTGAALAEKGRVALRGKQLSFQESFLALQRQAKDLPLEQRRLAILRYEARWKEDLEKAGGILSRDMSPEEIELSTFFSSLGHAESIPLFTLRNAFIDNLLENKQKFLNEYIPRLRNDITDGVLPEEIGTELDRIVSELSASTPDSIQQAAEMMGLTQEEIITLGRIRQVVSENGRRARKGEQEVNIPAVYAHATAAKRNPAFKSAADEFASIRGMSPEAVSLSDDFATIVRAGFEGTPEGFNADQLIGAQYPVFRQFISAGLFPGRQFGVNRWGSVLNQLEEGSEVFSRRVLAGHLNPYEFDPSVVASKHVRNMIMRREFDPFIGAARNEVKNIHSWEVRTQGQSGDLSRLMADFIDEMIGIPDDSFQKLSAAIRTMGRVAGVQVDERVGERYINAMQRISYSATIPLRAGTVARNSFQSPFLTIPIVGARAWLHGVKSTLGWTGSGFSREAMMKAAQRAIKAGALDPEVVPLHASSEIFGVESMAGRLGPGAAKLAFSMRRLFDLGYTLYRKPDDFGRVIAFEAGRFRVNQHMDDFVQGRIDLRTFKERAKVLTFDESVEAEFDSFIGQNMHGKAADHIGAQLADKVHFLYVRGAHPPGWNSVFGRMFGQFGTFPVQYVNYLQEGFTRGTLKDKVEFAALHGGMNAGIVAAGAEVLDADLQNWATFGSLNYSGGPYAEAMISLVQLWGGSDAEKALAAANLRMMLPSLNHPSVTVPGSYAVADFVEAAQGKDFPEMFLSGLGINQLRPKQETWLQKRFGWMDEIF